MPSPLISAAVTAAGVLPVAKGCWVAKLGVVAPGAVVLSSTDTVLAPAFATIRSGLPSPLISAVVTEYGVLPVAKGCWVAKLGVLAPGAVVLSSTDTVLPLSFATIRSGLPSPLISAAVTETGPLPVAKVCWVAKLGVLAPGAVVLSSTDTVLPLSFATIRSGLPSPLISAVVTETGPLPAAKSLIRPACLAPGGSILTLCAEERFT